jgi:hypothetical protein
LKCISYITRASPPPSMGRPSTCPPSQPADASNHGHHFKLLEAQSFFIPKPTVIEKKLGESGQKVVCVCLRRGGWPVLPFDDEALTGANRRFFIVTSANTGHQLSSSPRFFLYSAHATRLPWPRAPNSKATSAPCTPSKSSYPPLSTGARSTSFLPLDLSTAGRRSMAPAKVAN